MNCHPQETEREIWMIPSSSTKSLDRHYHDYGYGYVRKMAVVLLSVSVFSILTLYYLYASSSSSIASFLHHYYSMLVASYSVDINNKCIFFLLCNALLVFVAKSSASLLTDHTCSSHNLVPLIYNNHSCYNGYTDEMAEEISIKHVVFLDSGASVMTNSHHHHENNKEEEETTDHDGEGEVVGKGKVQERDDDYQFDKFEEEVEDGMGVLSTEELNRKFDEFIRKMKEDIRIEA